MDKPVWEDLEFIEKYGYDKEEANFTNELDPIVDSK